MTETPIEQTIRGRCIKCENCDGHGLRQGFDGEPVKCSVCDGLGALWLYPGGAIAKWYSGPLAGRLSK